MLSSTKIPSFVIQEEIIIIEEGMRLSTLDDVIDKDTRDVIVVCS